MFGQQTAEGRDSGPPRAEAQPRGSMSRIPIVPNAKQCKIRKIPREKSAFRPKYVIFAQEPTPKPQ